MQSAGEENTAASAGRVIDAFARLRISNLGHKFYNGAVCIKLGSSMAGVIREFFNQIFVSLTEIILFDCFDTQRNLTEMPNQ